MSVQQLLSYAMSIINSMGLTTYITAGFVVLLAGVAVKVLIDVFRR